MKQFFTVLALSLFMGFSASAQTSSVGNSPEFEARVTAITRAMTLKLELNEPSYIKLKNLNRERLTQTEALLQTYQDDRAGLEVKFKEVEQAYEKQLYVLLSEKQREAYAAYKAAPTRARFVSTAQ
ncbi:hypothetical protein ACXYMU_20050 [Pontibacter sp. CAU 1760]